MKVQIIRRAILSLLSCLIVGGMLLLAREARGSDNSPRDSASSPVVRADNAELMRVEGEQRFRTNCGRCHAAPQKFPPRMMKTVLRHMRVRATITDEDMRLVLFYMTQ